MTHAGTIEHHTRVTPAPFQRPGVWPTPLGGADMSMVADDVRALLADHVEWCQLGVRRCKDCAAFRDSEVISAIAIAKSETDRISAWLAEYPLTCVYCGSDAQHRDHLVPKPWTGQTARRMVPTVPACRDCNVRINDTPVFTIAQRAEIAALSLRRKWGKKLNIADRTGNELNEYAGRIRQGIEIAQAQRQFVRRRLVVLDAGGAPEVPESLLIAA